MSEAENYTRYVSQGTGGGVGGQGAPGQPFVSAPSALTGLPRTMPPIPEEASLQGQYRQMSNVNSFQANYVNQAQAQSQAQTTNVIRTTTSKRRGPTISRTELNQFKVENFRPLAEQNIDLRSAKVIPLDDMSVEEAHKFQGEIKTINLQPIEVKQTLLPAKTLIDRSIQLSDHQLPAEEIHFEPEVFDRKPVRGELPQEMPPPDNLQNVGNGTAPQRIMVKDVIRKSPAPEVESVHQFYPDKGLDWRTCCGIFAALLFIIGIAALLKYFLFVPLILPPPPPHIVTVYAPAPVPPPATVVATVASSNSTANNSLLHIEHIKIRKKTGGKAQRTRHVFTHDSATGKVTHAVQQHPSHNSNHPANEAAAPTPLQTVSVSPAYLPPQPVFQAVPMAGYPGANVVQMPPSFVMDSGMQMPGQIMASSPPFLDGYNGQMVNMAPYNSGPTSDDSGQIQANLFTPDGKLQPLVSFNRPGPEQQFAAPGEAPLQFVSETTSIEQPVLPSPTPPDAGRVTIEFEAVEEPDTSQVTLQSPPHHVVSQKTIQVDPNGQGQTVVQSVSSVSKAPAPPTSPQSTISIRVNPVRKTPVRRSAPQTPSLVIPHTFVLPDSTVIQRAVPIRPAGRKLKKTAKSQERRHDFDELDNTIHQASPKSPNDVLRAILSGRGFEPYRHMADFMGFSAAPEPTGTDNPGITYTFKNAGDAFSARNSRESAPIAVNPVGAKAIIMIRHGK